MRTIEVSGKTIDDALKQALSELGVSMEDVEYEVLEEPSKGFLGIFGAKPAKIKVTVKEKPAEKTAELLNKIITAMGLSVNLQIDDSGEMIKVNMQGEDLGVLIGRRGETLDALQYIVNLAVNKNMEKRQKIILDVEGYRKRRENTLYKLAYKLADKAKRRGKSVVLEPMNSHERRIIHTALQSRNDIYTFSEGEEPYRKIVITPKK
ncbi:spoIIIJ-associated protein [Desulfohalotomaculum tongense]|uniref:RNA-binding cell elongation regulator Jag/EloR n=1 Tax=Desulforadius tongensis TaxID=1216062 RepID=UPI0019582E9E|nr:RNA-binding cell elongation regulator Jag/EloR [Desulforadius tongensis]MBM7855825.1 spoIIIJ-associated protein [Desulforadius tongensis]